ncbi:MAG: twin-arginine translocase subunit TatC [Bacillota bacterium]
MVTKNQEAEMTLFEHLDELRKRIIYIAVAIFIAAIICFSYVNSILAFLTAPAGEMDLIYTTPAEAFMAQIRLAFTAGAVLTIPLTFYHVLAFIMPALRRMEKRTLIPMIIFMNLLFFLGMAFSYYVVFPFALKFFLGFQTDTLQPLFTISRYISFVVSFLISFGAVFQVPIVFWFLGKIGLISSQFLRRQRKFAILIMAIVAAIITPPDVFSQILMMAPLLVLYETGIFLVRITEREPNRKKKKEAEAQS